MVDTHGTRTRGQHARASSSDPSPNPDRPAVGDADFAPDLPPRRRIIRGPGRDALVRLLRVGRPTAHRLLQGRRRLLITLGSGAAVLTGLGSAAAITWGSPGPGRDGVGSPRDTGGFDDRDASYAGGTGQMADLGAAGVADAPSVAAAAAQRATPRYPNLLLRDPVLHLLRRATFGPTQAEVLAVRQLGVDAWIEQQLNPQSIPDPTADTVLAAYPTLAMTTLQLRGLPDDDQRRPMDELGRATLARQIWSSRQLHEVMVDFWANHINVVNPQNGADNTRGSYDRDVIRAHALGRFEDMLKASASSAAMMAYLNNNISDKKNVNENYGRELLELHTVGIAGGYTEVDVRNSAYITTGRTIDRNEMFSYDARKHWTGAVKVLGFSHPNTNAAEGLALGEAYLRYLAVHPATATNIARKLAVRFVCDSPPATLVTRLAREYLASDTAIVPVLRLLFRSEEFWIASGLKVSRPRENLVATARAIGVGPGDGTVKALDSLYRLTEQMGHAPLAWPLPNGYPDVAGAWTSAFATLNMWNAHRALIQGTYKGLTYPKPEELVTNRPATVGAYLDALAARLVFQPLTAPQKSALLTFLGAGDGSKATDATLGGKVSQAAPLILDSLSHALR